MVIPSDPDNEQARLQELYRLEILDTAYEEEFDEIVQLASRICQVPISLISLVGASRQWFKARVGLGATETSRDVSFCAHAIVQDSMLMEVEDAEQDERFQDNPLVTSDPHIRFYAGVPLVTRNGYKLGTLCVIDSKPNKLNEEQGFILKVLGSQIVKMLEMRIVNKESERQKLLIEQQNSTQNRILSIIAHDIRNPLSSMKQAMDMDAFNRLSIEDWSMIREQFVHQIDGTIDLLNNIVEWGMLQISGAAQVTERIHLKELVADKLDVARLTASLKNIELVNLADESIYLHTHPDILNFILRNLVSNAIKFTRKGTVSIFAQRESNKIHIAVNDTGVGISAEALQDLLSKRIAKTSYGTNNEKGSGLGLMLVQEFISSLQGSLEIESEMGKGTTVHLFLPG
ncbi:gaf sensor signal transduction histidine kinase [Russula earlei]|uniref:Gaf sensor signal transduction histidine kinase n=1 Tax=Russula earlei TaxID=71964 RepID=A0ACC0TT26_9AGAM|nr:gaf sensor signal transduction histidine kinase [Russula earlei]